MAQKILFGYCVLLEGPSSSWQCQRCTHSFITNTTTFTWHLTSSSFFERKYSIIKHYVWYYMIQS
jgi:hypothetical protein